MNVPSRSQSAGPGGGKGKGKKGDKSGRSASPGAANKKKTMWCVAYTKGNCKFGDKCTFPHVDEAAISAIKKSNENAVTKAKAKAKTKAKAKGKAAPAPVAEAEGDQ